MKIPLNSIVGAEVLPQKIDILEMPKGFDSLQKKRHNDCIDQQNQCEIWLSKEDVRKILDETHYHPVNELLAKSLCSQPERVIRIRKGQ